MESMDELKAYAEERLEYYMERAAFWMDYEEDNYAMQAYFEGKTSAIRDLLENL